MTTFENAIYPAIRGDDFKNFIKSLLKRGKLKDKYIDILTGEKGMKYFDLAFTSKTADPKNNYEVFEQIGDVTANKILVGYSYDKFPQLKCPDGVAVVARIKIKYAAKEIFAPIADKLGFWKYIKASVYTRDHAKKSLLEDCLEAFLGCTDYTLDINFRIGVGYAICYDIMVTILDTVNISLEYEDLFDSVTRLKEIFDKANREKANIGGVVYVNSRSDTEFSPSFTRIFWIKNKEDLKRLNSRKVGKTPTEHELFSTLSPNQYILVGKGSAGIKKNSQQKGATEALKYFKNIGYSKEVPEKYLLFCKKSEI